MRQSSDRPELTKKDVNIHNKKIVLQPLAMRIPSKHNVYSPDNWRQKKVIPLAEFLTLYADNARRIRVCFDERPVPETIFERSEVITGYAYGLDCWYIVVPNSPWNNANTEK